MTARCGFVVVLGPPNAGKSTLVNTLVGTKVSIVSPKVQTTRTRVMGIAMAGDSQIVFVDTPGIFTPKRRLERAMVQAAWRGAGDADFILLVLDAARGFGDKARAVADALKAEGLKAILVLNKIDVIRREDLLALTARITAEYPLFDQVFMVSALTGDGTADLLAYCAGRVPEGPWHFPEDQVSDMPMRLLAAEITREQVFLQLHDELPFATAVETDRWTETGGEAVRIDQTIYVLRDSQKPIVLGKGGRQIKAIGERARAVLEEMLERRVHLFLHVKVRENWIDDPERYRELGLDFDG